MRGRHRLPRKKSEEDKTIFSRKLKVVNIGISTFGDDLRSQGVEVVDVEWEPPAGGDVGMSRLLERLGS